MVCIALIGVVIAYLCTDSWAIVSGHPKRPMHIDHDGGGHRRSASIEERRLLSPMQSNDLESGGGGFGAGVDDNDARRS